MKKVSVKLAQFKNSYYLCIAIEGNLAANSGDSLAQLVEHNTFNVGVLGSSPRRITRENFERDSLFFLFIRTQDPLHYLMEHTPCVRVSSPQADHENRSSCFGFIFLHKRYRYAQHLPITQRITPYGRD